MYNDKTKHLFNNNLKKKNNFFLDINKLNFKF